MLTVFVLMGLGVMAGLFIRGKKIVAITVDKAVITCIFLLLFFMGLSIGSNETLLNALPKLGMNAILLTIGAIAGSVTVSYIVWKWFFDSPKNGMNNEN